VSRVDRPAPIPIAAKQKAQSQGNSHNALTTLAAKAGAILNPVCKQINADNHCPLSMGMLTNMPALGGRQLISTLHCSLKQLLLCS